MLDSTTKRSIDDCRDILVGRIPDLRSQIDHITVALIYKFMHDMDQDAVELGGNPTFFARHKVKDRTRTRIGAMIGSEEHFMIELQTMLDKEIYGSRLRAGNKTWCVEVREDANGSAFLEISESFKIAGAEQPGRIVVDKEHAEDLLEAMADVVRRLLAHEHRKKTPAPEQTKTYTVEAVRKEHPQAYARWTAEQDELLERLYCEGTPRKELASIFGREPSAITSRIKKLELREKYDK